MIEGVPTLAVGLELPLLLRLQLPELALTFTLAGSATSISTGMPVRVLFAELVATLAMSPPGMTVTRSLRSAPSTDVLGMSDRLKMRRVHARGVAAEMVDHQAVGDGANEMLVGGTVGRDLPTIKQEVAVPVRAGLLPWPAFIVTTTVKLGEQPGGVVAVDA